MPLCFPNLLNGSPQVATKGVAAPGRALWSAGVTFHVLRRLHASALIASGLDVLTIGRRFGHASPTITLCVDGHLFSNRDDCAAEVIDAALSSASLE